jgi:hypothetical protein
VWVIQPNTASFICCALIYFRHRTLLLYLSNAGTEGAVIDSCLFTRVDGLGVFISGYNRNLTVSNSTFEWIGEHIDQQPHHTTVLHIFLRLRFESLGSHGHR